MRALAASGADVDAASPVRPVGVPATTNAAGMTQTSSAFPQGAAGDARVHKQLHGRPPVAAPIPPDLPPAHAPQAPLAPTLGLPQMDEPVIVRSCKRGAPAAVMDTLCDAGADASARSAVRAQASTHPPSPPP